jgi:nicotinamidase-related amidase
MDSTHTALLVMDVQDGIVERIGDPGLLGRVSEAIAGARANGVRVIYVVVGFRDGYPEVHPRNRAFGALAESGGMVEPSVHASVAPEPGEPIVTKRRVSAFAGSDLEMLLRAGEIQHLVLTGLATSGVVLSTLRQASDLDFALAVLADACADRDAEVHRVLLEKVFPRQAEVLGVADWVASLR